MDIEFILIDESNYDTAKKLHISKAQEGSVETVEESYMEAKEYPIWRPTIISVDGKNAGFAMYGLWEDERKRVWLDRFFIDENFQGMGYAKPVLNKLLHHIQAVYGCDKIYLSVYSDNSVAIKLYEYFGFRFNGELDLNGEKVMVLSK